MTTTRHRLLVPFVNEFVVDLAALRRGRGLALSVAVRSELEAVARIDPVSEPSALDSLVIYNHRAGQDGTATILGCWDLDGDWSDLGLAAPQLLVGSLGACAVTFDATSEVDEVALVDRLNRVALPEWGSRISAGFWAAGVARPRPHVLLPPARALWLHRIDLVVEGEPIVTTGRTETTPADLHDATLGLFAATEDWLVLDTTNRILTSLLVSLDRLAADDAGTGGHLRKGLDRAAHRAMDADRQAQLLKLHLDDRGRYIEDKVRDVWLQGRLAWGLEPELENLNDRANSARELAATVRAWQQELANSLRDRLLFALSVVTALNLILTTVDFAVGEASAIHAVWRAIGAGMALVGSIAIIVIAALRHPRRPV